MAYKFGKSFEEVTLKRLKEYSSLFRSATKEEDEKEGTDAFVIYRGIPAGYQKPISGVGRLNVTSNRPTRCSTRALITGFF